MPALVLVLMIAAIVACASLGLPTPKTTSQTTQYARGGLDGVYDTVVILRQGGDCNAPVPTHCKLSSASKAKILTVANANGEVLTLLEGGSNPTTAQCLAIINPALVQTGQPPISGVSSCLALATQVITLLRSQFGGS